MTIPVKGYEWTTIPTAVGSDLNRTDNKYQRRKIAIVSDSLAVAGSLWVIGV